MKKILFLLLSVTTLFSSCSSDDDDINSNEGNAADTKTYTVNLNVKSAGFEVDKTPMKSFAEEGAYPYWNFQVVVYKESGEVYSDSVMLYEEFIPLVKEDGTLPFTLQLPEGKFHIALLHNPYSSIKDRPAKERNVIKPNNFYTDTYGSYSYGNIFYNSNSGIYFKTFDLEVNPKINTEVNPITLDPMWSEVYLTIKDPKTFKAPKRAQLLQLDIQPSNYGIKISTGKTCIDQYSFNYWDNITRTRDLDSLTHTFTISKASDVDELLKLRVNFLSYPSNDSVVLSKTIVFNQVVENGNRYRISGNIGNIAGIEDPNQSFSISLGSFNKDDVNIEF